MRHGTTPCTPVRIVTYTFQAPNLAGIIRARLRCLALVDIARSGSAGAHDVLQAEMGTRE